MVGKYIDKLLHFDQQETNDKHTKQHLNNGNVKKCWILIKNEEGKTR